MDELTCNQHGGAIRNADRQFVCCVQELYAVDSYAGKPTTPTPPPPGLRAQVAAALHAPNPTREGDRG